MSNDRRENPFWRKSPDEAPSAPFLHKPDTSSLSPEELAAYQWDLLKEVRQLVESSIREYEDLAESLEQQLEEARQRIRLFQRLYRARSARELYAQGALFGGPDPTPQEIEDAIGLYEDLQDTADVTPAWPPLRD